MEGGTVICTYFFYW